MDQQRSEFFKKTPSICQEYVELQHADCVDSLYKSIHKENPPNTRALWEKFTSFGADFNDCRTFYDTYANLSPLEDPCKQQDKDISEAFVTYAESSRRLDQVSTHCRRISLDSLMPALLARPVCDVPGDHFNAFYRAYPDEKQRTQLLGKA